MAKNPRCTVATQYVATSKCGCAQDGALELESAELRFETSAEGRPSEVAGKAEVPVMAVVAELMIFANSAVARRVYQAFPRSALLRRHLAPRPEAFKEVRSPICLPTCSCASQETSLVVKDMQLQLHTFHGVYVPPPPSQPAGVREHYQWWSNS